MLKEALEKRRHASAKLCESRALLCSNKFQEYLSQRNIIGVLKFNYTESTLDLNVYARESTNSEYARNSSANNIDLRGLSGGEKSIVTISFLLALWSISESPCLFMDEFDVFMDQLNRNAVIEVILEATRRNLSAQCVFITPQGISGSILAGRMQDNFVRVFKMPDPIGSDEPDQDQENERQS
jgi:DNA repair exonuclease SbcCD ATPase subunit